MLHYETALDIGRKAGLGELMLNGYVTLISTLQRQNKADEAAPIRRELSDYARKMRAVGGRVAQGLATRSAMIALNDGDLPVVGRWVAANHLTVETVEESVEPTSQTALFVRYLLALSQERRDPLLLNGVPELLARVIEKALAIGYVHSALWYGVLQVRTYQQLGQIDDAVTMLDKLLTLAEPGGYIRLFVDADPRLEELLQLMHARELHPIYIQRLLAAFAAERARQNVAETANDKMDQAENPTNLANAQLIEPLTARELEVLQVLAEGLKNMEIAEQLIITVGTVKRHVANIYGKLGVNHRTQAIRRAQELQLLPPVAGKR